VHLKKDLLDLFSQDVCDLSFAQRVEKIGGLMPLRHWEFVSHIRDPFGSSLLLLAASYGMTDVVRLLHKISTTTESWKQFVNTGNDMGWSPLLVAAQYGYWDIVDMLVDEGGADIDQATRSARLTPLMLASSRGHIQVAQYLLTRRANPWIVASNGSSCLDMVINARMRVHATTTYLGGETTHEHGECRRLVTYDMPLTGRLEKIRLMIHNITKGDIVSGI